MKKILVIEDDADTSDIVEFMLKDAGFIVITINRLVFSTEIAAINPNLIVLDYLLPHALGNELCIGIKGRPETKHIPVLLYSASNLGQQVADECQADAFIAKPFDIDHFMDAVHRLVL
ncbi:MAG: response regulator [Mucilaginibacter sp.]